MTNIFKTLDDLFPCGKERLSGEVVSISVNVLVNGRFKANIGWKRKQWYVNASVNAWHLHRCLLREFREIGLILPVAKMKKVKTFFADAVMYGYMSNCATDRQGFEFELELGNEDPVAWYEERSEDGSQSLACYKFNYENVKYAWITAVLRKCSQTRQTMD